MINITRGFIRRKIRVLSLSGEKKKKINEKIMNQRKLTKKVIRENNWV